MFGSSIVPCTSLIRKKHSLPLPRGLNIAFNGEESANKISRLKVEVYQNHTWITAPSLRTYNEKSFSYILCYSQIRTFYLKFATTAVIQLIIP